MTQHNTEANHAISVKMWTPQRKVQCVLWLAKFESVTRVQREYRRVYNEVPPHRNNINRWDKQLKETGSLLDQKRSGRPSVSDESVDAIRDTYLRSPKKSVRACARELQLKKTTVHKVLKKRLRFTGYRLQLLHAIKETDKPKRFEFASDMLNEIENDQQFLKRIVFSDEATFHVCGHVHRYNVRIWASENPHVYTEYERNSPKVNVWCALMHNKIIGPFFTEQTVTSNNYLDMLQLYAVPQIQDEGEGVIFQQDGAPPHYGSFWIQHFPRDG